MGDDTAVRTLQGHTSLVNSVRISPTLSAARRTRPRASGPRPTARSCASSSTLLKYSRWPSPPTAATFTPQRRRRLVWRAPHLADGRSRASRAAAVGR
eukprot:4238668-Prymnesium_polylepis.1